ncbi:MAG: hypothetical protein KDC84_10185 [Crocinitomicaceae bacterium]|nr:hypothetical protein [Crocinitomicaceae bacterium]
MKKWILIFCFLSNLAIGQSYFAGASYKMSIPLLSFKEHISPISFVGAEVDFRYFKTDWFSFGLNLGWSSFYEHIPMDTYYWDNNAITAEQWNYLYQSDFHFQLHFYIPTQILIKPYFGIKFGASFVQDYKKVGDLTFNKHGWGFGYTPEIGFLFHLPKPDGLAFFLSGGFNQAFYKNNHYNSLTNVNIKFGIAYSGQYRKATKERLEKAKSESK